MVLFAYRIGRAGCCKGDEEKKRIRRRTVAGCTVDATKESAQDCILIGWNGESVDWRNERVADDKHRLCLTCLFAAASSYVLTT